MFNQPKLEQVLPRVEINRPTVDLKPRVTVKQGERIERRDLSPGVDSAFYDQKQYDDVKTGDICRQNYFLNDRGEVIEEIVRKTDKGVRKENRPVVNNAGDFSGLFKDKPQVLEQNIQNASGKKVKDFVKKMFNAPDLNLGNIKRTIETSDIVLNQPGNYYHGNSPLHNDSMDQDKLMDFLKDDGDDNIDAILQEVTSDRKAIGQQQA